MRSDKRAIVLGGNEKIAFSIAFMINQLNEYVYDEGDDIYVYYDSWSERDLQLVKTLCDKVKCVEYSFENFKKLLNLPSITKVGWQWTHVVCSIFEIFNLVEQYDKVLWLDSDIIIRGNFAKIFDYQNIAMRKSLLGNLSDSLGLDIDGDNTLYNSGVVLVSKELRGKNLANKCYAITAKQIDKIRFPDQAAICYACYESATQITELSSIFHCLPFGRKEDKIEESFIIHSPGGYKVWNHPVISLMFPQFNAFYNLWINNGGSKYEGEHFFTQLGDNSTLITQYINCSLLLMDFYEQLSNRYLPDGFNVKFFVRDRSIKFLYKENQKIFYKILCKSYYKIILCSRFISNDFLEILKKLESTFVIEGKTLPNYKLNLLRFSIIDKKDIQYIEFVLKGTEPNVLDFIEDFMTISDKYIKKFFRDTNRKFINFNEGE